MKFDAVLLDCDGVLVDERASIEANTGKPLTPEWMAEFRAQRNACASGADLPKAPLQLRKVALCGGGGHAHRHCRWGHGVWLRAAGQR